jgi:hypothetical protein
VERARRALQWGDRYLADPSGGPVLLEHAVCGHVAEILPTCSACGGSISPRDMRARPRAAAEPA